ncbi:MAG: DUF898 domain-containing protein [Sneathiellales bacterium]|nr:DUF898 domain-containing protein [Sneathiellales bacterium]
MEPFITFDISKGALTWRLLKNKFLTIITLGIYRFWGKTHVRRMFWHSIKVGGERLQYHGTGMELFLGFLIAIAILTGVFFVFGLVFGLLSVMNQTFAVVTQLANFLMLYAFWQFAYFRLWRYRLSRTSLRTIRFYLTGKGMTYMGRALMWSAITLLTLGWAYPKLVQVRADYLMNNVCYGDQSFSYKGNAGELMKMYWPAILVLQLAYGVMFYQFFAMGIYDPEVISGNQEAVDELVQDKGLLITTSSIFMTAFVVGTLLFLWARVKTFVYITNNTTLSGARFFSNLSVGKVFLILFVTVLVSALIIGAYFGLIALVVSGAASEEFIGIAMIGFFIFVFLFMDILMFLFVLVPLFRAAATSISTDNPAVFEEVAVSSRTSPKYGEGLADALDVGAF